MFADSIFILGHPGLGDHILCSGIYRSYATNYRLCLISALRSNHKSVAELVKDVENIRVVPYESEMWMIAQRNLLRKAGFNTLSLGLFGTNWLSDELARFDENYYRQAGLSFNSRWDSFKYVRNSEKEDLLFEILGCAGDDYIFVHDDPSRSFQIDTKKLPSDLRVIRPTLDLANKFSFFDYTKIIEKAIQIHCIESSFCAYIESLDLQKPKYAHRYARPEAKSNSKLEFTYRSNWEVLT